MSKAKTASKNDPSQRKAAAEIRHEGKVIVPFRWKHLEFRDNYMAAKYSDSNTPVYSDETYPDGKKKPMAWHRVATSATIELFE